MAVVVVAAADVLPVFAVAARKLRLLWLLAGRVEVDVEVRVDRDDIDGERGLLLAADERFDADDVDRADILLRDVGADVSNNDDSILPQQL